MNLILTAFFQEYLLGQSLLSQIKAENSFQTFGKRGEKDFAVLNVGQGKKNCLQNLERFFQEENFIESACVIGFCGGLDPSLKVGDVVVPSELVSYDSRERVHFYEQGTSQMLTSLDILKTPEEKKAAFLKTGCEAVDMESFYLVQELYIKKRIPIRVIKCIMDDAHTEIDFGNLTPLREALDQISQGFQSKLEEFL